MNQVIKLSKLELWAFAMLLVWFVIGNGKMQQLGSLWCQRCCDVSMEIVCRLCWEDGETNTQDQQIFAVENSVICIQKYIIQILKRPTASSLKQLSECFNDWMGTVHISLNSCWISVYNCKQSHKPFRFERPRVWRNRLQHQWRVWFISCHKKNRRIWMLITR